MVAYQTAIHRRGVLMAHSLIQSRRPVPHTTAYVPEGVREARRVTAGALAEAADVQFPSAAAKDVAPGAAFELVVSASAGDAINDRVSDVMVPVNQMRGV